GARSRTPRATRSLAVGGGSPRTEPLRLPGTLESVELLEVGGARTEAGDPLARILGEVGVALGDRGERLGRAPGADERDEERLPEDRVRFAVELRGERAEH